LVGKLRNREARARRADREHRYFTCRQCGTICRVPVGKGKIVITCPKCGAEIRTKT
jgi:RNase P subunit RPR2